MTIKWFETRPEQGVHIEAGDGLDPNQPIAVMVGKIGAGDFVKLPPGLPAPFEAGSTTTITKSEPETPCTGCGQNVTRHTLACALLIDACEACGFLWLQPQTKDQ